MNALRLLLITLVLSNPLMAQDDIPIIKASSDQVDIKADSELRKNAWRIVPEVNPDVYTTSASEVTFYTDLDSIHFKVEPEKEYDFVILLNEKDSAKTRITWKPSRLDILKKAKAYDPTDSRFVPKFTYQSQDDPNLIRIREDLKLDSIAGDGNELSQIFNLMHWVHDLIRHDGSSSNPTLKNAIDLVRVCKAENRGVNCRMLATVLNECYLAMGIKSRYVTCMPRENKFDDCHVINMVFSTELDKWIWMDPTFDAYVMDEKGVLLGLQEVRQRLIEGRPLVLNADANWNRTSLQTRENYLGYYMAKNLYRLEAPLESRYNTETGAKGKEIAYVELLPLDGIEQTPQKKERTSEKSGVTYITYKTNNPDVFWAKPE